MERKILHIDVNNAFLSWSAVERLKNGEELDIRTIPAVIGGDETQRKGIVLAKSMKAKECGIITGEPIYFARKKCPTLKVYPSNYSIYRKYSEKLYELLLQYTDQIERYSIDECFLDMTYFLMKDTIEHKAVEIKQRVKQELGFTVNIGISSNKVLAKMASDFEKPDKVHTLYPQEIQKKMWNLPVSELFMLGKKTVPKLAKMQIKTIGDLAKFNKDILQKTFGKHGILMWEYANGIDTTQVIYEKELPKGIGNSTTLPYDISDLNLLKQILLTLVEQVAFRLRRNSQLANVVNIQLRTKDFKDYSHQKKLEYPTSSTQTIYKISSHLLEEMYKKEEIRLIGVRVDHLVTKEEKQISLFEEENNKKEKLDEVVDSIKEKYGYSAITRAGKLKTEEYVKLKEID